MGFLREPAFWVLIGPVLLLVAVVVVVVLLVRRRLAATSAPAVSAAAAPGWYTTDAGRQYWDGARWVEIPPDGGA